MLEISEDDIGANLQQDNPWWVGKALPPGAVPTQRRAYFDGFARLALNWGVRRSVILMGPRRVGKTVMLRQLIEQCLTEGFPPQDILFASLDTPLYSGLSLERLLEICERRVGPADGRRRVVVFDEIQYLPEWEVHLKVLTDRHPNIRFIASGSAAAALRLKSRESGAGRFTEFMLPPLTFAEFMQFRGIEGDLVSPSSELGRAYETADIQRLNEEFINYLNFGGYPEAVVTPEIREDLGRFLGRDIVDKVLLRDLPSLYGIQNIQELNRLFTTIAYHTGMEVSLDKLASSSGVSKSTIQRYLEYLEAAFLIVRVSKVNESARTFQRARHFKVYLTNPSMRAALFAPLSDGDEAMGPVVETAIFSQWFHSDDMRTIHYARWKSGRQDREVDLVYLDQATLGVSWICEVKWSDRYFEDPDLLKGTSEFSAKNGLSGWDESAPPREISTVNVTTKTKAGVRRIDNTDIAFEPCALYCYTVGKNLTQRQT